MGSACGTKSGHGFLHRKTKRASRLRGPRVYRLNSVNACLARLQTKNAEGLGGRLRETRQTLRIEPGKHYGEKYHGGLNMSSCNAYDNHDSMLGRLPEQALPQRRKGREGFGEIRSAAFVRFDAAASS